MDTAQLPGSQRFDTKMEMYTSTQNSDVSLSQEFKKNLSNASRKHGILYYGKQNKVQVNKSGQTESIICKIMKLFFFLS